MFRLPFLYAIITAIALVLFSCNTPKEVKSDFLIKYEKVVVPGAERMRLYIPLLQGKRVGMVVNHTSRVRDKHLVDTLLDFNIEIKRIFAPEHGFRGRADAGAKVEDSKDQSTGIPLISLYGKNKKPTEEQLNDLDIVVFDIQDVGCRFYTYISTLTYVMEACAQKGIPVIILDRPNPNGHYIDGPVLKSEFSSFVGLHSVPVVYGMTIAEYGKMVNGEQWMQDGIQCDLTIIECLDYTHKWSEELPVAPSPNLPNHRSVLLYPSLCFFEGTVVSIGRGTDSPFQHIGHPSFSDQSYQFTPSSGPGSKYPKLENQPCYGIDLTNQNERFIKSQNQLELVYILDFYKDLDMGEDFFLENRFIDKLAGSDNLRNQIMAGLKEDQIRLSWRKDLEGFMKVRAKYLLYED